MPFADRGVYMGMGCLLAGWGALGRPPSNVHFVMRYYSILYLTILYYTILYYTILYYTILYYTILYYSILYYIRLYHTIPYHIPVLHHTNWTTSENGSYCCSTTLPSEGSPEVLVDELLPLLASGPPQTASRASLALRSRFT